jgi:type I restriction enzyme M protein
VRKNLLDAVIGLPAQLFPSTGIPVCLLVFDRAREMGGARADCRDVVFVDASRAFTPGKRQNSLEEKHVMDILAAVEAREPQERYAHVASFAEIEGNGFNLNIPRYVDTFEPEPEIDVAEVQREIDRLEAELVGVRARMRAHLQELGVDA